MSDAIPARLARLFPADTAARLLTLRQDLHRRPELSEAEEETAARLTLDLERLRPRELGRAAKTGVVARIAGRDPGAPLVAIRGDIDALPVTEETGLPYTSERPGLMHACGHDVHATWAVGAAALLAAEPAAGDVLIVLQPAEEVGRGALALLASGALDGVCAMFGGHVDRRFLVGQVVADTGSLAAASDSFEVQILGLGAHGARPHESADPVVGLAAIIQALQTLVSRRLEPGRPAVVSIGKVQAGTARNVIPERALLAGTLRTMDPPTRAFLRAEIERIATATAAANRLTAEVRFLDETPPLINEADGIGWARGAVAELLGEEALVPFGLLNMAGEDFAYYLERMPGCFLRIGAREEGGEVIAAHSPRFYAADGSIFVGAAVLAETARRASAALAG